MEGITREQVEDYLWGIKTSGEVDELWKILQKRSSQLREVEATRFKVGEKVWFRSRGDKVLGTVDKINRGSVGVKTDFGANWRIAPSLLHLRE